MERDIIQDWLISRGKDIDIEVEDKILGYAKAIHETNRKFNITGFKTVEDILIELIIGSIDPLCDIIVPRGTKFVDIGSGAGIPGIVLAIYFKDISGVLIESNRRKAEFLKAAIDKLNLNNLEIVYERAEVVSHCNSFFRETFDWCFARAFGKLYITIEIGAPFVKKGGILYIFSNDMPRDLPGKILEHAGNVGLRIMSHMDCKAIGISRTGLCFKKEGNTLGKYPRRFAVIKREAERV